MRMLVGADVPCDPNAGAAGTVYQTNAALRELGHEVDEIWADDLGRKIRHGNLHYLIELPRRYRDVVRDFCKRNDYDVVQLSQPHAYLAAIDHQQTGRSGIFVNRSHGVELRVNRVLPRWHTYYQVPSGRFPISALSPFLTRLLEKHWDQIARWADGIVVPCYDDKICLNKETGVPKSKVKVVHHGIPQEFLSPPIHEMTAERLKKILYIGQFSFIKGPHVLSQIINAALVRNKKASFTWVCNDHSGARNLADPAILNRIEFVNWVEQSKLLNIYDNHGIFIFPSFFEGAGKACLEAMARGLCVIASDTGGMRDYIEHGKNGFLIEIGNWRSALNIVEYLQNNLEHAKSVSAVARTTSIRYTWKRCAESLTRIYEDLTVDSARRSIET